MKVTPLSVNDGARVTVMKVGLPRLALERQRPGAEVPVSSRPGERSQDRQGPKGVI